jgi:hypothetical protein
MPFAPCEALLRSGTRCRSATLSDSSFCAHHSDLVKHIGEERVRNGDRPRRRKATVPEPLVAEADTAPVTRNGADPAQVRPRLAEAAAASLDDIQAALLDAALGSLRPVWITHTCRNCSQKERIEVQVPDIRSRVAAIERGGHGAWRRGARAEAGCLARRRPARAAAQGAHVVVAATASTSSVSGSDSATAPASAPHGDYPIADEPSERRQAR